MQTRRALLGLATSLLVGLNAAHAQHFVSVSAGVERIENPSLASINPGGATVLRLEPSYAFEAQQDRIRSRLSLAAVLEQSSNTALLASRNYPSLGYTWAYSWPRSSLELRANLAESTTRNTELENLGRITVDSRERSVRGGASWSQELTARTRLVLDIANSRVSYDSTLLDGFRELQAFSRISWEATERFNLYLEPSYARLKPMGPAPETTRKRWLAGARGELLPDWSITSFLGQARTSGPLSATGHVAGVQLAYEGSRLTTGVDWLRDATPNAATSAYIRTGSLALRLGYRVSETATFSAGLTRSRSSGTADSRGQVASLSIVNEHGVNWSSVLGVEDRRSRTGSSAPASGWSLRIGLTYAPPGR